jgi:hypothetical protein
MAYQHNNRDPNLNNLHHAMELVDDLPHLRVTLGSDNITITGDVNLVDTVTVNSTPEDPVHIHITEIGTSGLLAVPYMPIQGTVSIGSDGTVSLSANTLSALENITVSGSVSVSNFPATQAVTGTFWQATQPVSIATMPTTPVTGTFWQATQPVSIATMPTTPVTGTFWQATQPVSGTVTIQDGGNTITVDGTVTANVTFPTTQQVSGTVALDANTLSALENISATVSGTVELGTTTLSALENVGVTGTVTVQDGGGSITVDGAVSATVSGTVELGASTLSALENTTVTISGTPTVNIGTIPEVEIKNDSGNPIPISGNVNATLTGTAAVTLGAAATDAFGRLRVSNPYTLFDGGLRYFDNTYKWDQVDTGSAVSTFLPNESSILMNATGAGSAIRQTKQVFSYQPGKSLLVLLTFVMNAPTAGITQRAGYFGAENGVYFEVAGTTKNLVIRKSTSGSVDDTTEKFPQNLWNGDKLDGTGASGITLDVTKSQIFWTDIEWLGVGTVRCGFVMNGQFIVCHSFHHANILNKVYMTSATLPLRYELISTGPAATMRAICSTVMSEGGYSNRSFTRAIGTALTGKNLSDTAYRPLVCLRMKSTALDSIVVPTAFDVYGLQLAAFAYRIILNPTLTGASWTSADTDSTVEYDLSATALSGGKVITQGVFVGSNKGGSAMVTSNEIDFSQQLGRTIAGVSDIWCLAAIATTNNDDAVGIVNWQEHN